MPRVLYLDLIYAYLPIYIKHINTKSFAGQAERSGASTPGWSTPIGLVGRQRQRATTLWFLQNVDIHIYIDKREFRICNWLDLFTRRLQYLHESSGHVLDARLLRKLCLICRVLCAKCLCANQTTVIADIQPPTTMTIVIALFVRVFMRTRSTDALDFLL